MNEQPRVFVFWDNSNIFISAKHVAADKEGERFRELVRIQFDHLFHLAHADRPIAGAVAVGSIPPELREVWGRFRAQGVKVELYERGQFSKKEQGVDQCLQVSMLRASDDEKDPQIAVLLTGDGAGYDDGVGFHADLERMEKNGWGIEVLAWQRSCRRSLREWAKNAGVFVPLEDFYDSVTFLEDGNRVSQPLNLSKRMTATPRAQPDIAALQQKVAELERANRQDANHREELRSELNKRNETIRQLEARIRNAKDPKHVAKRQKQRKKRARAK